MTSAADQEKTDNPMIMLGILESVERDGVQSQRHLAAELGVALGLVNAYLKRCVKKGLLKVSEAPARRYAYYLTPHGFSEKSRLTVQYLSHSFDFFRRAKSDCSALLQAAELRGIRRIVLAGKSDLAEIAAICALDHGIEITAVVDAKAVEARFVGVPVRPDYDSVDQVFDAVLITDMLTARERAEQAIARFGDERVLIPQLLRVRVSKPQGAAS
ncbi:winged helix-turn-helix transcriptional regulator [Pseudorhodoplanes sp.]|uniref:winged helix-turn-helix transcriptional regulator n=1 Tax=Pseudorhodoplanes sp. TaxID=1934341 RepID=UPI002CD4FEEE|nr:winged helix-turn-helix transcriptional regulator [Pseudorhodoplanes sp.]HWV43444.1 winged helix-turn-helix transcriptional regulator [Pseudorhodoplanes sp.]